MIVVKNLLEVEDLRVYFFTRRGVLKAVDGVSFTVKEGHSLGLVGESGCGKSVTALSLSRLVSKPGKIVGGRILLDGENLLDKSESAMRKIRGRKICMILQDPMTSLDPLFTIGNQVEESLRIHQRLRGRLLKRRTSEMLIRSYASAIFLIR